MNEPSDAERIRERIHQKDVAGLRTLADDVIDTSAELLNGRPSADRIMGNVHVLVARILDQAAHDVDVGRARLKAMLRYLLENGQYQPDSRQLSFLLENKILRHGDKLVDLGAGPAGLLNAWKQKDGKGIGTDLSPSFVSKHPDLLRLGLIDDDLQYLADLLGLKTQENDAALQHQKLLVHTGLTLDRVARPMDLVKNVTHLARGGTFAIGALFPILAEDDEKVSRPVVYTPHRHRIANTGTVAGDKLQVQQFVEAVADTKVRIIPGHYNVTTNSGPQEYDNERYVYLTNAPE